MIGSSLFSKLKEWQSRSLESIYPFVWLDNIHYKIKDGGKVGGGAIGYEFATFFNSLGVNVHMVEFTPKMKTVS